MWISTAIVQVIEVSENVFVKCSLSTFPEAQFVLERACETASTLTAENSRALELLGVYRIHNNPT